MSAFGGKADISSRLTIEKGCLSPDKRKDLNAVGLAIEDFMFDCFTRALR
jgi:hypothetical protein